jgi:nicotinamidase/pyrazinamidase
VGTQLATSADAPSMSAVYKMVELDISGIKRFTAKYSEDKPHASGAKQIFRDVARDVVARSGECGRGEALLRPVILGGRLVEPLPTLEQARAARCARAAKRRRCDNWKLAEPWPVIYSRELRELTDRTHRNLLGPEPRMTTVFYDIDTQLDFVVPLGRSVCSRAPSGLSRPSRGSTGTPASQGIPLISTTDAHAEDDVEFRSGRTHCVSGCLGQRKPQDTLLEKFVVVPNRDGLPDTTGAAQIILEKQTVDMFETRTIAPLLDRLAAGRFVVYGVVTEVCVWHAAQACSVPERL